MAIDRLIDIYEEFARQERLGGSSPSLCAVAAEFLGVAGAGIAVMPVGGAMSGFCTSNGIAKQLMDLEMSLGEGPSIDACASDAVIAQPDLSDPPTHGWVSYAPLALAAGARAVFSIPLRIGAIRVGALSLVERSPGALSDAQSSDAYLMASVVVRAVLAFQIGARPDSLGEELGLGGPFDFTVHQATGMVAVQGAMSVGEALARLRAHAFASDMTVASLAGRVIYREVLFDPIDREWRETGTTKR
jgi:hypothetical protein